ncbi:MAG: type I DNA topoisomerase, partial [Candidatus Sumerlaeota bacterium]|nr:type I DNA topoisomerase [Candidatus Sumerlaeota bacterium]
MNNKYKLVIVESPAKGKTIEKFLGPGYKVAASFGHIRDLPSSAAEIPDELRDKPWARMAVDVEHGFKPVYVVPPDSRKHVAELRKLLKGASELLLATDEDREGESISWHLLDELKPGLPVRRITFHEITKSAIQEALAHPRDVDMELVRAQESRRILDRLFGYSLSPVLWKKIRTKLSAGRVQSVAVRLIVEREEERRAFKCTEYWDVEALLRAGEIEFGATLTAINNQRLASGKDFDGETGQLKTEAAGALVLDRAAAERIAKGAMAALPWKVGAVERRETRQRPWPPFTTSTLQQAASSNLNMPPKQTMSVAQRLYEGMDLGGGEREGLITYMRTDSVTLSEKALQESGQYIKSHFGEAFYGGARRYQTKSKSAQEAHEAIRPTEVARPPESVAKFLAKEELALYRLIWNRTVASQMADAVLDKTAVDFLATIGGAVHSFRANGSVVRFPGFLKVYGGDSKDKDALLPELKEGQLIGREEGPKAVKIAETKPCRHQTQPPPRYTEASLIKKLEDEGIGRPSTYAPTIS